MKPELNLIRTDGKPASPYKVAFIKRGYCRCFACSKTHFAPVGWDKCLWTRLENLGKAVIEYYEVASTSPSSP